MAILTVGPTSTYPTIAAAMAAASAGDTVQLQSGYSNETAVVTQTGMTVTGDGTSTGISLSLGAGVATFSLGGTAPINVLDALDGDGIVGNDGNNVITVTGGADSVNGGAGTDDRLVVDYSGNNGAVTGDSTSNFAQVPGLNVVTITGGFEHFTVLTGAGADTITTGAGDDVINTGDGAGTIVAGAGDNTVTSGDNDDTITTLGGDDIIIAGDGANTISAGEGANTITGGNDQDTITAGDGGNVIDGGNGFNTITTGSGIDIITGGLGTDVIDSGGGNDVVTVNGGDDTVHAGAGSGDRLIVDYATLTGAVSLLAPVGGAGTVSGPAGNSVIFDGVENLTITTGSGSDTIATGDGDDILNGAVGNDTLDGGAGADDLDGGADTDELTGGAGNDTIDGGIGSDTANYTGAETDYTITYQSPTQFTIVDNRGGSPDGTDILTGVEFLRFSDGVVPVVFPNFVPVITSNGGLAIASINVAENTTVVTTVTASDPDLDTPTFSLVGGADLARFAIDATTGALSFITAPDFENPTDVGANNTYGVIVRASDGNGGQDDQAITVTVTDSLEGVNDAPVITSNGGLATAAINVAENATAVTTVTATDADLDTPTFSLAGGADQARFTINTTTGALAFITAPDFENPTDAGANNSYDVIVRASDGNGGQDDQALSVTVTDVDDTASPDNTFTMAENGKNAGTVVYDDVNDLPVAYTIAGGLDGAQFAIDATTGALTFLNAPDFEEPTDGGLNNVYDVNVTGTHGGGGEETHLIQVTVTNVDGNDITGTKKNDAVNQQKTVNGQPKPTGEEDTILGKKGNDKLSGLDGNDIVKGGQGKDKVKGSDGDDLLYGNSANDKVNGQQGDDQVYGGGGKDKVIGGNGNDLLHGDGGRDKLVGKSGDDFLEGGRGIDVLTGGKGADTFYFSGNLKEIDVVKDFGAGDTIQLDHLTFASVGVGQLSQANFDEFFNYKNGKLSYDDDGAGGSKGVVFATFTNKVNIDASDIMLS